MVTGGVRENGGVEWWGEGSGWEGEWWGGGVVGRGSGVRRLLRRVVRRSEGFTVSNIKLEQ